MESNKKTDIKGIEDIKILVDDFYKKVRQDELLAPIFDFRLSTHWEPHLEKMYSFWNAALFGERGYNGNPFMKHMTMELDSRHFDRWLSMFNDTISEHFEGPTADEARQRALAIAAMFQARLQKIREQRAETRS